MEVIFSTVWKRGWSIIVYPLTYYVQINLAHLLFAPGFRSKSTVALRSQWVEAQRQLDIRYQPTKIQKMKFWSVFRKTKFWILPSSSDQWIKIMEVISIFHFSTDSFLQQWLGIWQGNFILFNSGPYFTDKSPIKN